MKAVICTRYGPPEVLRLQEAKKPMPKDHEVLVKIHATAVTASDCIIRGFKLPIWHPMGFMMGLVIGFSRPKNPILGLVLAGEIEAIGKAVTNFEPGNQVFGFTGMRFGCYAEYVCLPAQGGSAHLLSIPSLITLKPSAMTYEEAAAVPYGSTLAWYFLKKGHIQQGQKILIYGASGAIGTTAIQIAKHHYRAEVTGVCSTANVELVKSLGADHVLDYTKQESIGEGVRYDFILDAVGKKKVSNLKFACMKALAPDGKYRSVDEGSPVPQLEDLVRLKDLIEAGHFKAVIDRYYRLEDIVEAHRYVDQGHKKGNVVITVAEPIAKV